MPEGGNSMFETVKGQGETLINHEERIGALEETDKRHEERIRVVESNYTNLENTILKSSQSQQDFFRDTMSKQWDLITARDVSKDIERQQSHEIAVTNQDIKKTSVEKAWEFAGKLTVGGGILYLLVEKFMM